MKTDNTKKLEGIISDLAGKSIFLGVMLVFALGLSLFLIVTEDRITFEFNAESEKVKSFKEVLTDQPGVSQEDFFERNYDVNSLGNSMQDSLIKYGYALITETHKLIGPNNGNNNMAFAGNNLDCKSCHLNAGTKKYAAPYIGVNARFPQYRGRENKIGSVEERINGCMQRSMNGKKLPENGREMRAMVAYMNWLGKGVPAGEKIKGSGFKSIKIPNRKVDLAQGKKLYGQKCASCHQQNGKGTLSPDGGYTYPPIAGDDSYNHGAGMHRVLTAAQFIKYNMPFGVTADDPILSDEEAYDIAGYINSLARPQKTNTDQDFPNLKKKPVSTPYGPWADSFPAEQHKYGPFNEIIDWYLETYNITKTK